MILAAAVTGLSLSPGMRDTVYADTVRTGVVNTQTGGGAVFIRSEASTTAEVETSLTHGTTVTVREEGIGTDGCTWYRVTYTDGDTTYSGWVRGDLLRVGEAQEAGAGNDGSDSAAESGGDAGDGSEEPAEETAPSEEPDTTEEEVPSAGTGGAELPEETGSSAETSGTVTGDVVNVRSGAGTDTGRVTQITMGTSVTITGQETGSDGSIWYAVTFSKNGQTYSGYMHSSYVAVSSPVAADDPEAVAEMESAGFPHSYAVYLATMHRKYPEWQFVPVNTGLDWEQVIAGESVPGRNLVPVSFSDATKSTDPTVYDWATNTWALLDGNWVAANSRYIAYVMDPRNYLSDTHVFQFETLDYQPYQTADGVRSVLSNTFMAQPVTDTDGTTLDYAQTFASIGSQLSVSPYHLAARVRQEQGTAGTSPMISGTSEGFEGFFNYFNINAYQTSTGTILSNGLSYAQRAGWNTRYRSLFGGSEILANRYVAAGQNTLYFEKFNVVDRSRLYTHQYMTNLLAAQNEGVQMKRAYSDLHQAYVFRIPVYQNMPEEPCGFTDTGNQNNWLSGLGINGYALTPAFSPGVTEYSLYVGQGVSDITITASSIAQTSGISGAGSYPLSYGNNEITVTCTSQDQNPRDYHLLVVRSVPEAIVVPTPETPGEGSESGQDSETGQGSESGETAQGGETGQSSESGETAQGGETGQNSESSESAEGSESGQDSENGQSEESPETGESPQSSESSETAEDGVAAPTGESPQSNTGAPLMPGDLNGDGRISNLDLVWLQKRILGLVTLSERAEQAADINHDGVVNNVDLIYLKKHILGIQRIVQ